MKFTKMHGLGNDYVYVNCFEEQTGDPAALARAVSDRHRGIGGDGLILVGPSKKADVQMRIFNADGSEAEMCGNGIRCAAKFAYEHGLARPGGEMAVPVREKAARPRCQTPQLGRTPQRPPHLIVSHQLVALHLVEVQAHRHGGKPQALRQGNGILGAQSFQELQDGVARPLPAGRSRVDGLHAANM